MGKHQRPAPRRKQNLYEAAKRLRNTLKPDFLDYEKYRKVLCVGKFDTLSLPEIKKHYFVLLKNHWLACDMASEADQKVLKLQDQLEKTKKDLQLVMKFAHPCTRCKKKRAEYICTTCHTFINCDECHTVKPFCSTCYPPSTTARVS